MAKPLDPTALAFSTSIHQDIRLLPYDVRASSAWAEALQRAHVLTQSETARILRALKKIGRYPPPPEELSAHEDVHSYVESRLRRMIGDAADKLHTGRSRNDQVLTDVALYVRESSTRIVDKLRGLARIFLDRASREKKNPMPGFTHMQPAQVVTLGAHLLAYAEMILRDLGRVRILLQPHDACPLGCGAIGGTTIPVDRFFLAQRLGFSRPTAAAMDTISSRDLVTDYVYALTITLTHLSRFSEEIILWSNPFFGFVRLPDDFSTGSSLMPQKRNPDLSELTRGRAARAIAALTGLLALQKGLPLTYNRDLQEDKIYLFDTVDLLDAALDVHLKMVPKLEFVRSRMREACAEGFMEATDLAEYLALRGLPFRQAHEVVGRIVADLDRRGRRLRDLTPKDLQSYNKLFGPDAVELLTAETSPKRKRTYGSVAPAEVGRRIMRLRMMRIY
ncbi:argininosuccinate lyase [bacterium]|nr:argininosuccinate lyase [bacterium]